MNETLQQSVKNYLPKNPTEYIIVALSGGVDSMVLFDILYKFHKNIVIAHVNHKLRIESDKEFEALKKLSIQKSVLFEGYEIHENLSGNFHEESRKKRQNFFISVAKKYSANHVFLAHHENDQVETFLMRFMKGYSFQSMTSIQKISRIDDIQFIHPFLDIPKDALIDYAKRYNIQFFEDASNKKLDYTRNRVRNNLIPFLKDENPNIENTLLDYIKQFKDMNALLDEISEGYLNAYTNMYDLHVFTKLNPLVQVRVIQLLLQKVGVYRHPSSKLIETLISLLTDDSSTLAYPLINDFVLRKEYDNFTIAKVMPVTDKTIKIEAEGFYKFDDEHSYLVTHEKLDHKYRKHYCLWYNDKVFPLYLRYRQDGDRIQLSYGTKKLKSLLIDKKIPPSQRSSLILLANDEEVLWIPFLKMGRARNKNAHSNIYVYEVQNVE